MKTDLEQQLESACPKKLDETEKALLWTRIQSGIEEPVTPIHSTHHAPWKRFGFQTATAAIVLVIAGGSVTIAAADAAMPGDLLFPVDLAVERVRIVLADDQRKQELRVASAQERLDEARVTIAEVKNPFALGADDKDETGVHAYLAVEDVPRTSGALTSALEHLETTQAQVESGGANGSMEAVDGIIDDLRQLAREHVDDLEMLRESVDDQNIDIRERLEAIRDELKVRFDINGEKDEGNIELTGGVADRRGTEENVDHGAHAEERVIVCFSTARGTGVEHTIRATESLAAALLSVGGTSGPCSDENSSGSEGGSEGDQEISQSGGETSNDTGGGGGAERENDRSRASDVTNRVEDAIKEAEARIDEGKREVEERTGDLRDR